LPEKAGKGGELDSGHGKRKMSGKSGKTR